MPNSDTPQYEIKTARTVFSIIEALHERNGMTLTETSEAIDKSISATHNHLKTLEELGYIVERKGEYHISLKFLHHGMHALRQHRVQTVAKKPLQKLAEETEEIVWLVTEERGKTVALEKQQGERAVQTEGDIGRPSHMHCTANGKAILAYLEDERVEEIIDEHGLPQKTRNTITDKKELIAELEQVRERDYAINDEESVIGARSIGCPIRDDEETYGAVSITGPTHRMSDERIETELLETLLGTVNEITLRLNYDRSEP